MKKFENILLISDIDGTLIGEKWEISRENIEAAQYFMENGGTFTYATGRQVPIAQGLINQLFPNAPVICHNGAAIYDYSTEEFLWTSPVSETAIEVIEDIFKNCPGTNIEINCKDLIYVLREPNTTISRYGKLAPFYTKASSLNDIPFPWLKVVFVTSDEYMPILREYIQSRPYFKNFQLSQSATFLYELLNLNVNKGTALPELKKILGNKHKVIAIGDNENDIEFLKASDVGFAVSNASPLLLEHSPKLTVHQKNHALADIVDKLDKGLI